MTEQNWQHNFAHRAYSYYAYCSKITKFINLYKSTTKLFSLDKFKAMCS